MVKHITHSLISLVLLAGLFAPWATILLAPEYAFAQSTVQVRQGSAAGNQAERNGGSLSLSEAAAGGVVSIGGCLAAAGISIGAALTALAGVLGLTGGGTAAAVTASAATSVVGELTAVPVYDRSANLVLKAIAGNTYITATVDSGHLTKETVLDCIAWALAKMIWRAIVASVIDWINSGFNGRPAFIQNLPRFLLGIADQAVGSVIAADSTLSFLCSPFSLSIRLALAVSYSRSSAPACTLTQVMKNIKNFMQNFSQGGWPSWLELNRESNNPYGAYLLGRATISLRISTSQGTKVSQLNWGQGFLSKTEYKCTLADDGGTNCKQLIVTPGQMIAKQAGEVIGQGNTTLLLADELDEAIQSIVAALLQKALQSFAGLSGATSYQDDYYRYSSYTGDLGGQSGSNGYTSQLGAQEGVGGDGSSAASQIDGAIETEKEYQQSNQTAINLINATKSTATAAQQCWSGKIAGGLSPTNTITAQTNYQTLQSIKDGLSGQATPFQTAIDASNAHVASLQTLKAQAATATTQDELNQALNAFYALVGDTNYSTDAKIADMDTTIANLQTSLEPSLTAAQNSAAACNNFPPADTTNSGNSGGGGSAPTPVFTVPDLSS